MTNDLTTEMQKRLDTWRKTVKDVPKDLIPNRKNKLPHDVPAYKQHRGNYGDYDETKDKK